MKTRLLALLTAALLLLPGFVFAVGAEETGCIISISDGETLSGTVDLSFFSPEPEGCAILLDGKELAADEKAELKLFLTAAGVDYQNSTLSCGDTQIGSLSKDPGEQTFSLGRDSFGNGIFEVTLIPSVGGSALDTSKVYGTYNIDDFTLDGVAVALPSGEKLAPKTIVCHYPIVGASGTRDETTAYDGKTLSVGDGWSATTQLGGTTPDVPIFLTFCFDVSGEAAFAEYLNGRTLFASADTTAYDDGEHTFSFRFAGGSEEVKVFFDNTAPVISVNIENGALVKPDEKIVVTTDGKNDAVLAYVDGNRYYTKEVEKFLHENANTHLLTVKATDPFGNSSYLAYEFYVSGGDEDIYELKDSPAATVAFSEEGKVLAVERAEAQKDGNTFRVAVGENRKLVLRYRGTSSEKDNIRFSVLNVGTNEYIPLRIFPSGDTVFIEYEANEDTIRDGFVTFKAEEYVYSSESDTMIWISDTQYYTAYEDILCEYEADLDYYTELYQKGEAGFLLHTGDVADDYLQAEKARAQMKAASELHKKLDDLGIPYGIVDGNHDAGQEHADSKYFVEQFGSARFEGTSWFYGSLDDNTHHYDLVTLHGQDFLLLWLGYGVEATPEVLAWANMVLDKYPDRNAIILTHAYLDTDNDWVLNYDDVTAYNHSRAPEIWENLVVPHGNVVAVFCGHTPGVARNLRKVDDTRSVWEVLADYQFVDARKPSNKQGNTVCDGEGYLRIVSFADGMMTQKTYSPFLDDWNFYANEKEDFTVEMPLNTAGHSLTTDDFVPFVVTDVLTGGTAEVEGEYFVLAAEYTVTEREPESPSFLDRIKAHPWIVAAAAVLLAGVIVLIIVLVKKKKKKAA